MKKLISLLLTFMIIGSLPIVVEAKDVNCSFITKKNELQDCYVKNNIASLILAQNYKYDITNMSVGEGIYVFDTKDYEIVVYPVFYNNHVIATMEVISDDEGNINAAYSNELVDLLNKEIKNRNTNPLKLTQGNGEIVCEELLTSEQIEGCNVIQPNSELITGNELETLTEQVARSGIVNILNWTTHDSYVNQSIRCVPYSLHNILYNKHNYSKAKNSSDELQDDMHSYVAGTLTSGGIYNYSEIVYYCQGRSILYDSCVNTGKMSFDSIASMIGNGNYAMALCTQSVGGNNGKHAIAIVGINVTNTTNTVIVYDCHVSGLVYVTYGTNFSYTSGGKTNTWNQGQFVNLH